MPPSLAARLALRVWRWRTHALLVSVLALGLVAGAVLLNLQLPTRIAFTAAGPVIGISWSILCVASWFHPENGTLSPSARVVGRLPAWFQALLRWYASAFLIFFVLFCIVAWPVFALSTLWLLVK